MIYALFLSLLVFDAIHWVNVYWDIEAMKSTQSLLLWELEKERAKNGNQEMRDLRG